MIQCHFWRHPSKPKKMGANMRSKLVALILGSHSAQFEAPVSRGHFSGAGCKTTLIYTAIFPQTTIVRN